MRRALSARILIALTLLLSACATTSQPPLQLAQDVDLQRVMGGWHIVATIPNWFEKGFVAPYDSFAERPDHDIREDFDTQWGSFAVERKHYTTRLSIRPDTGRAHWRAHFGPIDLPFLLMHVDPEGRYLLWGEENRSLGWIYARDAAMDDATYRSLLRIFEDQGYDVSRFRRVVQKPDDIGQPGYWSDGISPATH